MATYYPLIGNNIIASFVDAGAAAVTRTAGATLANGGWPGKRRAAVVVTATPASVVNDRILTLNLLVPDSLLEISAGVQNLNKMRPTVHATSGNAVGATPSSAGDYGYFYNLAALTPVAIDANYPFDTNGAFTAGFTHTVPSTDIVIVSPGVYAVDYTVSGLEANQMGLFLDATLVPGSIFGSGAGTQPNVGFAIVTTTLANQVLTLRNRSSAAAVTPQTLSGGTQANTVNSVRIRSLSGGAGAATPDAQLVPTYGAVTTAVVSGVTKYIIPIILTMSANAPAGANTYNVDIDWGWSSAN